MADRSESLRGEIRWRHVARSRAVRRIVEKNIAHWAALAGVSAAAAWYRAHFQREGDGHLVHCEIEIVQGNQTWIGSCMGEGLQQALADCLAHMNPHPGRQAGLTLLGFAQDSA